MYVVFVEVMALLVWDAMVCTGPTKPMIFVECVVETTWHVGLDAEETLISLSRSRSYSYTFLWICVYYFKYHCLQVLFHYYECELYWCCHEHVYCNRHIENSNEKWYWISIHCRSANHEYFICNWTVWKWD